MREPSFSRVAVVRCRVPDSSRRAFRRMAPRVRASICNPSPWNWASTTGAVSSPVTSNWPVREPLGRGMARGSLSLSSPGTARVTVAPISLDPRSRLPLASTRAAPDSTVRWCTESRFPPMVAPRLARRSTAPWPSAGVTPLAETESSPLAVRVSGERPLPLRVRWPCNVPVNPGGMPGIWFRGVPDWVRSRV